MLMLVSCRNNQRRAVGGSPGFSLIELTVALVLVSMLAGVAFPGLVRLYGSVQSSIELEEIILEINGLGRASYESGNTFSLDAKSLNLPDGWRLEVDSPVVYTSRGLCKGGSLSLIREDVLQLQQQLKAPWCRVDNGS